MSATGTAAPTPEPRSILVVDDAPENLMAMRAALSDMAATVVTADSGKDALRKMLGRDFAVILLDVSMPELDGFETARIIRSHQRYRRLPIIFLTAYDRDELEVLRAYELGAVDFLFKPIQPQVLRAKVSVFVELEQRTAEVAAQAKRLRELERREHQQQMAAQRRELEAAAMARQVQAGEETARRLAEIDRRKDEFLAMLGHELRTPLAALVTGLQVLQTRGVDEERRSNTEAVMNRQLDHLVRLVDDLVDVTRIRSGRLELERQVIELSAIVERAAELARPALESHRVTMSLPDRPIALEVDPVRIVQAVCNLLHNAARYTPEGGSIALTAEPGPNDQIVIAVEDDGIGISPDRLDRVFDMYVQLTPGSGGLGLGLALTKHLVDLHGGHITALSDGIGQGARFEISLPVSSARVAPEPPRPASPRPPPLTPDSSKRVVIIEDDDDLRETLSVLVSSWGHDVMSASCGRAGLELVRAQRPDIVLIDVGLPDIDGCDVASQARADADVTAQLIALTGFTQDSDRRRISEAGFDSYMPKPPDIDALQQILNNAT